MAQDRSFDFTGQFNCVVDYGTYDDVQKFQIYPANDFGIRDLKIGFRGLNYRRACEQIEDIIYCSWRSSVRLVNVEIYLENFTPEYNQDNQFVGYEVRGKIKKSFGKEVGLSCYQSVD